MSYAILGIAVYASLILLSAIGLALWGWLRHGGRSVLPSGRPDPAPQQSVPGTNPEIQPHHDGGTWRRFVAVPLLVIAFPVMLLALLVGLPVLLINCFVLDSFYRIRWKALGIPIPYERERELAAEQRFWTVIEADGPSLRDDPVRHLESIRNRLVRKTTWDLEEFQVQLERKLFEACTWDLRGASYLVHGRDSEDVFTGFRAWLITRGESIYREALFDADSLADVVEPYCDGCKLPELRSLAEGISRENWDRVLTSRPASRAAAPMGERWDFGDPNQISRRLPRLAALYLA
jgi:hypothetical protein